MSDIGEKIRSIRTDQGITIQKIAEDTNLSSSFISRMERGDISPSLSSIKKIADALNISVGHLFENENGPAGEPDRNSCTPEEIKVVRESERRKLVYPGQKAFDYLLTPSVRNVGIEFILTVLEPGGSSGEEFYSHQGEECILVIKGSLRLYVGEQQIDLNKGDSIHFMSSIPHRYKNTGTVSMEAVWATVPPTF